MRAVAVIGPGRIEVVDIPRPEIEDYECLVKTTACGFCNSTDLKILDGHLHNLQVEYPLILGHEGVGEVIERGSKVRHVQVGERFANPPGRIAHGVPYRSMWSAMSEFAVIQDTQSMAEDGIDERHFKSRNARPIPSWLSPADGAILLTIKENRSALRHFGLQNGMDVLVYGDGPVGFGLLKLLKVLGAGFCACVGHHDERLSRISERTGTDVCINANHADPSSVMPGRTFDLAIDAVGKVEVLLEGAKFLKPGGRLGAYGVLDREKASVNLLDLPNNVLLHMLNFPYREHDSHDEVVDLVERGRVNPRDYYSDVMDVSHVARAVDMIRERRAMKVILTF